MNTQPNHCTTRLELATACEQVLPIYEGAVTTSLTLRTVICLAKEMSMGRATESKAEIDRMRRSALQAGYNAEGHAKAAALAIAELIRPVVDFARVVVLLKDAGKVVG